jgi:hypothetical protein
MSHRLRLALALIALTCAASAGACGGNGSNDTPHPASQPPTGWRIYGDARLGFSIAYPSKWRVDSAHVYPNQVDNEQLAGVAFLIPEDLATGTNLSSNSYLSVESAPNAPACNASAFLDTPSTQRDETEGGLHWSVGTVGDAGAGNFYDETAYALTGSKPCLGIRYFIHSTNIGNYTPGTVKQFDRAGLVQQFDRIRSTFALARHGAN